MTFWATGRTGRRSPHSISVATLGAARASWIRISSGRGGTSACQRTPATPSPTVDAPAGPAQPHREPAGHLPELVALGLGSLACAALARRAGRRRRIGVRFTGDAVVGPSLSEGALDAATLLHRFAGVPALHSFEAANCLLGLSLDGRASGPTVRAICVSASGVTFCFADAPRDEPPQGFVRVKERHGVARQPRCPRGPRPLPPLPARRAAHRRRRRGDLARPARTG